LNQELCHEPERAGIEGALGGDGLHERQQRMGLTSAHGLLLPQSEALVNDGASVRMPSCPTRFEAGGWRQPVGSRDRIQTENRPYRC
jgi:hypothetical protein